MFVWKVFITPSFLKNSFPEYGIFDWMFFSFSTLNLSSHSLLDRKISANTSADSLMGVVHYLLLFSCCFHSFLFVFDFWKFDYNVFHVNYFGFILLSNFWASWICMSISFFRAVKLSAIISSNKLSGPFSLPSSCETYIKRVVSHKSLKFSSLFFTHFFFFSYD